MSRSPVDRTLGTIAADGGIFIGNGVLYFTGIVAPVDGVAGTGAGIAGPGSQYTFVDAATPANCKTYINLGSLASPAWTVLGTQA